MSETNESALVLFSGGQDSTTCLAWALDRFETVETVGFDYGQRHSIEMHCRDLVRDRLRAEFAQWGGRLGDDHVIDLSVLSSVSETALTRDVAIEMSDQGLPNTFVPGRNLLFLTMAGAVAYRRGVRHLVGGMCETDFSGYPDCRDDTLKAMQLALSLGMDKRFVVHTPLMWIDKTGTWELANDLGGEALIDLIIEDTHTCYLGHRDHRNSWGYGCGKCPACDLRAQGWIVYQSGRLVAVG